MNLHGILNRGQGRLRVTRPVAMLAVIGVAMLGGIAVATNAQATPRTDKAWVCKYVGIPYVNETLKNGNDGLVWVDSSATQGTWFNDQHGSSFVLLYGSHDQRPDASQCPAGRTVTPPVFHEPTCDHAGTVDYTNTEYYTFYRSGPDSAAVYKAKHDGQTLATFGPYDLRQLTGEQCARRVVLPTLSATRVCVAVGTVNAVNTADFTWGFTGPDTARMYTATPIGNVVLVGTNPQGPFDVSAIPAQSTTPTAACYVPPPPPPLTTVAAPVFTPGTCLAVGSVVAPETSAYAWIVSGPATARTYQAVAKAGFTLTGTTAFGPFDLSQLPADSAACVVAPPAVVPPAVAPTVLGVVKNAPVKAPVVAGVVKSAPVKTLAFTGAETVPLGLSGLLALVLGAVLTVASRRQAGKEVRE